MKVEIRISGAVQEPNVVICTKEITEEITQAAAAIKKHYRQGCYGLGKWPNRRIKAGKNIYGAGGKRENRCLWKTQSYSCAKRLYEIEEIMGNDMMRISKSALINLKYLDCVEPSYNGMMLLKLKKSYYL